MKKYKLILFLFFLLSVLVVLFFSLFSKPKEVSKETNKKVVEVSSLITTEGLPKISGAITFTYQGTKVAPTTLPAYQGALPTGSQMLRPIGENISTILGITATASSAIINNYYLYLREQPPQHFSLTQMGENVTISYQLNKTPSLPASSTPAKEKAQEFFINLNIFPSTLLFTYQKQVSAGLEGGGIPEYPQPILTNHVFGLLLGDYYLLTPVYNQSWAFASIDQTGTVRFASTTIPYSNIIETTRVSLITPEDAVSNLALGRGVVTSVSSMKGDYFGEDVAFTEGLVNDYDLVYIYQKGSILPAYRLLGVGQTPEGPQGFEAIVLASPQ